MTAPEGYANPLRDERDRRLPRIAGPCGLVLFGVTGDLSTKKVMPASCFVTASVAFSTRSTRSYY